MNREDFDIWKRKWFDTVPRCRRFLCIHELTSCGVERLCGDCTIFPTWNFYQENRTDKVTCTDVGCIDCFHKYDCDISGM